LHFPEYNTNNGRPVPSGMTAGVAFAIIAVGDPGSLSGRSVLVLTLRAYYAHDTIATRRRGVNNADIEGVDQADQRRRLVLDEDRGQPSSLQTSHETGKGYDTAPPKKHPPQNVQ